MLIAGLCAVMAPSAARAQSKAPQEVQARGLLDEARALLDKGDYESGCSKLRESMTLAPTTAAEVELGRCVKEADRLFRLGASLLEKQDFKTGCPHFEQSMKVDPSAGTQINIAACLVQLDENYPAACLAYQEARRMNRNEGDDSRRKQREADIATDLKRIAEHLPKLHVDVTPQPGLLVAVDGERMDQAMLAAPFSVCPGDRVIEISAIHREAQTQRVRVAGTETKHLRIELRALEGSVPAPVVPPPDLGRSQRIAGMAVGATGLFGFLLTAGFTADAVGKREKYIGACPNETCPSLEIKTELKGAAEQSRDVAIGVAVGSAALLGIGAIVYGTAPSSSATPVRPSVSLHLSPGGIAIRGGW
ncbi:MAG: hypothetical protein R3F14_40395 [Polyangiaceae bacterium]